MLHGACLTQLGNDLLRLASMLRYRVTQHRHEVHQGHLSMPGTVRKTLQACASPKDQAGIARRVRGELLTLTSPGRGILRPGLHMLS
jgi:hypothetical protein